MALQSCVNVGIEPAAKALVESMVAQLQSVKTLRLTGEQTLDPARGVGSRMEKGPLHISVKRPNSLYHLPRAEWRPHHPGPASLPLASPGSRRNNSGSPCRRNFTKSIGDAPTNTRHPMGLKTEYTSKEFIS